MRVCRDIQSAATDERLAMARYQTKSDIKPKELADDDITDLVAFPRTLTGTTVCNPPFGVLRRYHQACLFTNTKFAPNRIAVISAHARQCS